MNLERRRQSRPDPSAFENPQAEKMYYATEQLLDEASPMGGLRQKFIVDSWNTLKDRFIQQGESEEEARQLAWGTTIFFAVERFLDIGLAVARKTELDPRLREEFEVLSAYNAMVGRQKDSKQEDRYIGEPFWPGPSTENKELNSYIPEESIDPTNPDSPIFGHIQLLNSAANRARIPERVINSVLGFARISGRNPAFLKDQIESWNTALDKEMSDKDVKKQLLEIKYGSMVLGIIYSWGEEDNSSRRHELLDIYLSRLRKEPNDFKDFLSTEGIEDKIKSYRRSRGESEDGSIQEYDVPESTLKDIRFASSPEMENPREANHFAVEVRRYMGLDFGIIINWSPEDKRWIGHIMVSTAGHNPPRYSAPPIRLNGVETPAQAAAGMIQYYVEHVDQLRSPKNSLLSDSEKKNVLKRLTRQEVRRLGPPEPEVI